MRFIETLEKVRAYLLSKDKLTVEEQSLLGQIRDDLSYVPTGVVYRDDIPEYGYEAHLISDGEMATIGKKMGADSWEQLSSIQIPIIVDSCNIKAAECPICASEASFENDTWTCDNEDCKREWSYMKFVWLKYTDETAFLFKTDLGYMSETNRTNEMALFLPIDLFRMHFSKEPEKEIIYQVFQYKDISDIDELIDYGHILQKVTDQKGLEKFGMKSYWMSYHSKSE